MLLDVQAGRIVYLLIKSSCEHLSPAISGKPMVTLTGVASPAVI